MLYAVLDDILRLSLQPLTQAFEATGSMFVWCLLGFSAVLVLVAAMDVPFQLFEFNKQIRMTKQEVKDEMKETDGKPEVKSAIREKQQEMANQRMMSEVPTADVIITNPTHYAVALRYDQDSNGAPRVVAKGKDFIAKRIREIAEENEVAIFRAPPLARALYGSADINQEIPGNLFMAVAQVLANIFNFARRVRVAERCRRRRVISKCPKNIAIGNSREVVSNGRCQHNSTTVFNCRRQSAADRARCAAINHHAAGNDGIAITSRSRWTLLFTFNIALSPIILLLASVYVDGLSTFAVVPDASCWSCHTAAPGAERRFHPGGADWKATRVQVLPVRVIRGLWRVSWLAAAMP